MSEYVDHNCGLVVARTLHDIYGFLKDLQHRGREAAGIAAVGHKRIDVLKWEGRVDKFDPKALHDIFSGSHYHTFMGHVRYATKGRKDRILLDAHPHTIGGRVLQRGDHTLILDCEVAGVHNGQVEESELQGIKRQELTTDCDTERLLHYYKEFGEHQLLRNVHGSYTIAIADKRRNEIVVLRDRTGIKPGVLGWKDGKYGVASEEIAFRKNGGEFIEDLEPGTIYYLDDEGDFRTESVMSPSPQYCFFEHNYVAHKDSVINGTRVWKVRKSLGEILAKEFPLEADIVTYLPRCPETAARPYAKERGIPFKSLFYKMREERSFQASTQAQRKNSIDDNLHLLPGREDLVRGKTIIGIEDSTVRGTVLQRVKYLLKDVAGARDVFILNYTPQIGIIGSDGIPRGCTFGVDMPPLETDEHKFIARGRTIDEISAIAGMPVRYISLEGMLKGFERAGLSRIDLCTFCIGGEHPFKK